jgi:hypothetical protein
MSSDGGPLGMTFVTKGKCKVMPGFLGCNRPNAGPAELY